MNREEAAVISEQDLEKVAGGFEYIADDNLKDVPDKKSKNLKDLFDGGEK